MNFDLQSYLAEKRELVEAALEEALPAGQGPDGRLWEAMRYSVFAGGKRLRPVLCLAAGEVVGGDASRIMPAAVALEFIHTYSLIHDDLPGMDDDDLRRGRPSNHMVFGQGLAVLAGDGLLTRAFQILAGAVSEGVTAERAVRAVEMIASSAGPSGMVSGQVVDLASEGRRVELSTIELIHLRKTAALLAASTSTGALLGGGTDEDVHALESYGRHIGLAFQIIDDILDIEGETESLGKPAGSDQARGKATYPRVVGMEASRDAARSLVGRAVDDLSVFGVPADPLRALAEYLLVRKK